MMTPTEMLIDMMDFNANWMKREIGALPEEVNAIPPFELALLDNYFDKVHQAMYAYLRSLPEETGLDEIRKGFTTEQPVYAWVRHVFQDTVRHFGEVFTLKAMWERRNA